MAFNRDVLYLDVAVVADDLARRLRHDIGRTLRRTGAVVGISGGIDSSVVLALAVRALGSDRVLGVLMPERESSNESTSRPRLLAQQLGVATVLEDLTSTLEAFGCYRRRDDAVRRIFPEYGPAYRMKIGLPGNALDSDTLSIFHVTVITPDGEEKTKRLDPSEYLEIVASTNFKQRARMAMLYHHAEARNYAVVGTPNRNEHGQGFFVRWGDGGYDIAPIRHLYKTQVFQLANYLGIPEEIRAATPTTDTYSAPVSQEEFFFRMPFDTMDLIWWALDHHVSASEASSVLDLTEAQVRRAYEHLERTQRSTEYLRSAPIAYE
jgi:NAD+ synthase